MAMKLHGNSHRLHIPVRSMSEGFVSFHQNHALQWNLLDSPDNDLAIDPARGKIVASTTVA